jgi:hypothetical protein
MTDDDFKDHVLKALEEIRDELAATRADVRTHNQLIRDLTDAQLDDHEELRKVKETIHPPPSNGAGSSGRVL